MMLLSELPLFRLDHATSRSASGASAAASA